MKNSFTYAGLSLKNQRKTNMDALLLAERIIDDRNALLISVCDGVGSLADGGTASAYAVRLLNEWFHSLTTVEHIGLRLRDAVSCSNRKIIDYAREHSIDTASTLSALLMLGESYYIVNIGDSRIYSMQEEAIKLLTCDDVDSDGALTAAIGFSEDPIFFYSEGQIDEKLFIICSDGFYRRINFEQEEFLLNSVNYKTKKDMKKSIRRIIKQVINFGEKDNISVAFARNC